MVVKSILVLPFFSKLRKWPSVSAILPNLWGSIVESFLLFTQDLEGKSVVDELTQDVVGASGKILAPDCVSLAWSADGQTLFAGYTDNVIRVWQVTRA